MRRIKYEKINWSGVTAEVVVSILFLVIIMTMLPIFRFSPYIFSLITFFLFYTSLALSWNILGGIARQPFLGISGFLGIGGYITLLFARWHIAHPLVGMWIGGLCSVAIAILISPALKLRGDYFAIGSLVIPSILMLFFYNTPALGSCNGISVPADPLYNELAIAYTFSFIDIIIAFITYKVLTSNFGLLLRAVGNDEDLVAVSGVNTFSLKLKLLLISAFLIGLSGGVYAYYMLSVLPQNIFDPFWGLLTLLNCVIGGIGTIFGPILGALVMVFLTNLVGAVFVGIQRLIVGLVLVLFVIMFPEGLMPFFRRWLRRSYLR